MSNSIRLMALFFLLAGLVTLLYFFGKAATDGYSIALDAATDYQITGLFGDFVGGVVGTFFALAGTFLIYLTFQEQAAENKRRGFETTFFEMIRLHRENVHEMRYRKWSSTESEIYENRHVMRVVFQEFIDCYREVRKFSNSTVATDYVAPSYLAQLRETVENNNPKINPIELARIDIAYCIMFYGLSTEGETVLRRLFRNKYRPEYYYKLLYYMKLKPKKSNRHRYSLWTQVRKLNLKDLHKVVNELYENRHSPEKTSGLSQLAADLKMHLSYKKYYGGHQFRLGHYFRHLYQSFNYLSDIAFLSERQKYSYAKMYRVQLSTYEQALLFVNSLSAVGMRWELLSDTPEKRFITRFQLIKNLPGEHLFGIRYKTYYPNVSYETDEYAA